uniref:Uncharacterized protein n=1 Tax=Mycena chlorophos TaxID=658473 RepID=A0ABQ0LLZ5_MYCCL|nr:predicted protein [Mycena chlorophos]
MAWRSTLGAPRFLVRIPRECVLSVKSSPISHLIPSNLYGRGAQLCLALALSVELANGEMSAWHAWLSPVTPAGHSGALLGWWHEHAW